MSKQERDPLLPPEIHGEKNRQFKGVRMRKWGKWVSEVRIPNSRAKIWLGSYDTAEQAARAFDAAIFCLRGPHAIFNFPDALPVIPSASELSRQQIQLAAAKYARGHIPLICKTNDGALPEKPSSPPISSTLSEMETLSDSLLMSEDLDFVFGESLLSDGDQLLNLDKLLSHDAVTSEFFDGSHFWNF